MMSEAKIICPLTKHSAVTLVEKIQVSKLNQLYAMYGIDTKSVFQPLQYIYRYHSVKSGYDFYYPFELQGTPSLYEALEKNAWYYLEQKWEHIQSLKFITSADKVLEIGCGQCSFLLSLKNKFGGEPIGLEMNQHAIEKATSMGLNVKNEDLDSYAVKNREAFDVVCFYQVLEHIADPLTFLQKALLLLRKGGKLILAVPNNDSLLNKDVENALNYPPHHMGLWTKKSLVYLTDLLNIKLEHMQNEPLQREHYDWYVRTRLKYFFGARFYHRILSKTIIPILFKMQIVKKAHRIEGHTIMAVYKK